MANETNFPNGITSGGKRSVSGSQSVTGTATIATGLATVSECLTTLRTVTVGAGNPWVTSVTPSGTAGSIDVVVKDSAGTNSTAAVVVNWTAHGTPA